jgi:23S rRNA pseudouridine2605 synthase
VTINGKTVTELGTQVSAGDEVSVDGRPTRTESPIVIALNKPKGYICSRADERDRMTIYALLPKQLQSLHHVGRLDKESEGLLLMTNRGDLSHHLIHPSKGAEKEYEVVVDKPVDQNVMSALVKGMMTEEGHAKAERAWMQTEYRCHLVLKQGLKRQIRLMFYQLGFEVERLTRTRIGWLELKGLPKGSWKQLTEAEVQRFFTEAGTTGRTKPAGEAKPRAKSTQRGADDGDDEFPPTPTKRGRPATKRPSKGGFGKGGYGKGRARSEGTQPSSGRLVGRARYARAAAIDRGDVRPAPPSEGHRSRSGPPRRSGPSRRPGFEDRGDSFEGGYGDSPRRSGPPRRGGGFRDRDESFSEDSDPPRRTSKFGDRSGAGPRRPRPGGRDDSADRSGPPRRSGFGDRSGPPRRSGPPGRSGPPSRGGPKKPGGRGPRGR